jgi:uncharacterized repeat protein (TIGR02543 family)
MPKQKRRKRMKKKLVGGLLCAIFAVAAIFGISMVGGGLPKASAARTPATSDEIQILAFLNQTDGGGVKNGEKLGFNMVTPDVEEWGEVFTFNASHALTTVNIPLGKNNLAGTLDVSGTTVNAVTVNSTTAQPSTITSVNVTGCTSLNTLTLSYCSNTSAIGYATCTNLQWMYCGLSGVTGIESNVSALTKLRALSCSAIVSGTTLDLSLNIQLRTLTADNNPSLENVVLGTQAYLYDIHIVNCPSLVSIDYNNCPALKTFRMYVESQSTITSFSGKLDFSDNPLLDLCYVYYNPGITEIDISACTLLRDFRASGTSITSLDISNNSILEICNIGNIKATSLDASNLPLLKNLDLNNNSLLSSVNVTNTPELAALYVYNCPLLTSIDVSANQNLSSLNISGTTPITSVDLSGNPKMNNFTITNPSTKTIIDPVRPGWKFAGWFTAVSGGGSFRDLTTVTGYQSVYAYFVDTFDITYSGVTTGHTNPATYTLGETPDVPFTLTNPTARTGYTFDGWYTLEVGGVKVTEVPTDLAGWTDNPDNITLWARWNINPYTITWNLNNGAWSSFTPVTGYNVETGVTLPTSSNISRLGYTFDGWYTNSGLTVPATNIAVGTTGNQEFWAKWNINPYTITFNSNGGSAVSAITQNYDTSVSEPADPTRTGYTFAGWFKDNTTFINEVVWPYALGATNETFFAKWNINPYTLTFNSNGGSAVTAITQNYNTSVSKPANPTKAGYTFVGWFKDDVTFNTQVSWSYVLGATNETFFAKWALFVPNLNNYSELKIVKNTNGNLELVGTENLLIDQPGLTFVWTKQVGEGEVEELDADGFEIEFSADSKLTTTYTCEVYLNGSKIGDVVYEVPAPADLTWLWIVLAIIVLAALVCTIVFVTRRMKNN